MDEQQLIQMMLLRDPGAGTAGRFEPLARESLRLQNLAAQQALAKADTTELERAGYERSRQGQRNIMAGMSMATAIPEFHPLAQQTHRAGLAAQEPWEVGEGVFTPGAGYTADPFKRQDRLTKAAASQAGAARDFAGAYGSEDARIKADERAREQIAEQKRHARVQEGIAGGHLALARDAANAGKIQKVEIGGNEILVRVNRDGSVAPVALPGAVSAAGGVKAYPTTPSVKATEDERRSAYQVEGLAGNVPAAYGDPNVLKPGLLEAAARTMLPGRIGEAAANFLSTGPRQKAFTSQEAIVDTLLWLATGAAYTDPQFQQRKREVMIGLNDAPEQVAYKRQKLADYAVAARNRAGRAWTQDQEDKLQAALPWLATGEGGSSAPTQPAAPTRAGDPYLRKEPR